MNLKTNEHLKYWVSESDKQPEVLVFFLHGSGERGSTPEDVLQWGLPKTVWQASSSCSFQLVAPQCPSDMEWSDIIPECVRLLEGMRADAGFEIPVVGAGFSMGGQGVLEIAASNPGLFQSVLAVAPRNTRVLKTLGYKQLTKTRVLILHGEKDPIVPLSDSQAITDQINQQLGDVRLEVLANRDHFIADDVFGMANFLNLLSNNLLD